VKTIEITEASLIEYGRRARKDTWVLTRRGKPIAAVVPIRPGMDLETFGLSHNAEFIEIVNRAWAGYKQKGGVSLAEIRRKFAIPSKASRRRAKTR
jgi:antitoxin (DNA-binding transcriptional repressor) of toxin-antitoxin stability system